MPPTTSATLPPVALYIHIPFCVSLCPVLRLRRLCRGGGPGPAQPGCRVPRGTRDRAGASRGRRSRHSRRSRGAAAARNRLLRRWHAVAAPSRGHCAAARPDPGTVRDGRRGRGDARSQPRARRARRRDGVARCRRHPDLARGAVDGSRRAPPAGPAARTRGRGTGRRGGTGRGHRLRLAGPAVRRPGQHRGALGGNARRGPCARARPPVAVRADARRPGCGGAHGRRRRPPPHDRRSPALARPRTPRPGRRSCRGPVPPRRAIAWPPMAGAATRSATGRGPATRAATTSCTGSAGRTRRSVRGRTPSMAPHAAGTRRGSTATWRRSPRPTGASRACRPGAAEAIDHATAAAEALILGLRTDRGVPVEAATDPSFEPVAAWATETGLLERRDDRLVLTTEGRLLSNELFSRLV